MAKGNMLQGQATGKVGDLVFMVRNGQQIARVYTSAGGRSGDQASIATRRQRVRFGAASNQYLLYRNIVRGMYRTGKATKQSDYNYFVRENVNLLPFLTKEENAAGVKCVMPGTFSRGTLGSLGYNLVLSTPESNVVRLALTSQSGFGDSTIANNQTVGDFKAQLKLVFPFARKVTFCMCRISKIEVGVGDTVQWSHQLSRYDVIFDLFEEDSIVSDTDYLTDYFAQYVTDPDLGALLSIEGSFTCLGSTLIQIDDSGEDAADVLGTTYINVFATNDQVGDCYTTTMYGITAVDTDGGLDLYSRLRTDNHRQVAEDSYGYATGVMRTNIQQS